MSRRVRRLALAGAWSSALVVVLAVAAHAQVSPGPLSAAHRALDGPTQCFQCHAKAGGPAEMQGRCLACHTEIGWMRQHQRGLHARVKDPCSKCHPDHAGRDFALIAWDGGSPQHFDHARAGWTLEGKHAQLECRSCHRPESQHGDAAALIRKHDRGASWLGLDTACASCHRDPHAGSLGRECTRCHGMEAWKPAPRFDHATTDYPLTGAHARVECAKCHATVTLVKQWTPQGAPVPVYTPVPHVECSSCHSDPHAGRFGPGCAKCHTTADFEQVNRGSFDHDRTRYPLRGRHAAVACERCHDPKTGFGQKPAFAACTDCHADAHAGQATLAGKRADCAACHTVDGFTPSTFTVAQHRASAYPLDGRHATAACAACHRRLATGDPAAATLGSARVVMRPARAACSDCHLDPHRGRFSPGGARARAEGCVACHSLEAFRPSGFDAAAHARSGFALEGAHRATPCLGCHASLKHPPSPSTLLAAAADARVLPLDDAPTRCAGCHTDPHGGQFAARQDKGACSGCHGLDGFAPAARFDHARDTRYKLDGAHARAACAACHRPVRDADGATRVRYHGTPTACEACHATTPAPPANRSSSSRVRGGRPLELLALEETRHGAMPH